MILPNIRKLFTPDPGMMFFDMDLKRADLQVVVWEAEDDDLKKALALDLDLHCFNAVQVFKIPGIPLEELVEGDDRRGIPQHPNYKSHREKIGYKRRHSCKEGCHAVNYFCQPRTLATVLGTTVKDAENFKDTWLGAHPGILRWHERTAASLAKTRTVTNRLGYRRVFFDRVDSILPEALGWIPQSTVACVINRVWIAVDSTLPQVEVLLQVHDSLAGQFPVAGASDTCNALREISRVTIPYDDPLIIPSSLQTSQISWGDCS